MLHGELLPNLESILMLYIISSITKGACLCFNREQGFIQDKNADFAYSVGEVLFAYIHLVVTVSETQVLPSLRNGLRALC